MGAGAGAARLVQHLVPHLMPHVVCVVPPCPLLLRCLLLRRLWTLSRVYLPVPAPARPVLLRPLRMQTQWQIRECRPTYGSIR